MTLRPSTSRSPRSGAHCCPKRLPRLSRRSMLAGVWVDDMTQPRPRLALTHPTTRLPDYPTTRLPDYPTTRLPDYPTTRLPDYPTTRLPDYPTTRLPDYPTTRLPDYPTTRLPDYPTTRLPDYPTTRLPDYPTTRLPDYPTTRLPDYPTTRLPRAASRSADRVAADRSPPVLSAAPALGAAPLIRVAHTRHASVPRTADRSAAATSPHQPALPGARSRLVTRPPPGVVGTRQRRHGIED